MPVPEHQCSFVVDPRVSYDLVSNAALRPSRNSEIQPWSEAKSISFFILTIAVSVL